MIGIGAGDPKAICSSLIADVFKEIDHPVLPFKDEFNTIILRHPTYCLPKDFDTSPFFQIIKPDPQNFLYTSVAHHHPKLTQALYCHHSTQRI